MIQWYPGHMAKAKREIEEKLRFVDIVYELVDARIPSSSRNPMINDILKNKQRLILMTKADMTDVHEAKKWEKTFNAPVLLIDSISGLNINKIVAISNDILKEKFEKEKAKGLKARPIRCMIVGIPNVGKSTIINKLVKKKVTIVGNKPGVTKAQQWVRINQNLELLDTPGVLWPKFEDPKVGIHLALTGAIKNELLRIEDLVLYLLDFLKKYYPKLLQERYNVLEEDNITILKRVAKDRGLSDEERAMELILNEYRANKIGKICLDRHD